MKGGKKVMSIQDELIVLAKIVAVKEMQVHLFKEEKKLKEKLAELKNKNKTVTAKAEG